MNHRASQGGRRHGDRAGFTLVELLVVVSVIALLIAIMLPALAMVRATMQATGCLSNQRQLMVGWSTALAENKELIPYTVPPVTPPSNGPLADRELWWGLLAEQFPEIQRLDFSASPDTGSPYLCPTIDTAFNRPIYSAIYFGYSVNARWTECGPVGESSLKKWSMIKTPSSYPWLADPEMKGSSPIFFSSAYMGLSSQLQQGLGFYHLSDRGNTVFADGHAEQITEDVLKDTANCGTADWFFAERLP